MSSPKMPLSRNHGNAKAIVLANASQPESGGEQRPRVPQDQGVSRKKRPYLFKMLQHHLGSHIVSDTLDWDALIHFNFDSSTLSLDNVYKALNHDMETYYFLWVAVRKVLAEAPNIMLGGAHISADQKTQFLNELLDATLEQFFAELGDAVMNFVQGPHCTVVDLRKDSDAHGLRAKARSLVTRFEKLGRNRDMIMVAIPATEEGIQAASSLQREDGINVNLTSVSGLVHATACAQAGAVAVTLPIAKMREWRRDVGRDIADSEKKSGEDAETIAAYFELHGFSSTTELIAGKMDHVDDACPLAACAALSFDADQARQAEWRTAYPPVLLPRHDAPPDRAMQRARAFARPMPDARTTMKKMDMHTFRAFASITSSAVGGDRAAMHLIAGIAQREIAWQMFLAQPLFATAIAASSPPTATSQAAQCRPGGPVSNGTLRTPPSTQDERNGWPGKRKRSTRPVEAPRGEGTADPGSPTPPPKKRAKRGPPPRGSSSSSSCGHRTAASPGPGRSTGPDGEGRGAAPRPSPAPKKKREVPLPPYCRLWERLGGRNVPSWAEEHHDGDEGKGRDVGRRL